jgi:hypothetical protein
MKLKIMLLAFSFSIQSINAGGSLPASVEINADTATITIFNRTSKNYTCTLFSKWFSANSWKYNWQKISIKRMSTEVVLVEEESRFPIEEMIINVYRCN